MIPYFARIKAKGPPHLLKKYGLDSYTNSILTLQKALHDEKISYGVHDLTKGLLDQGSITLYPAGEGINYARLIKNTLDSGTVKNALIELSNQVPENVDVIFGIQNSGIVLANVIGFHTRKRVETVFKTTKQKYVDDAAFGVLVDSYTQGQQNVLYIDPISITKMYELKKKIIRIVLVDDICDTGALLRAVCGLLKNASLKLHVKVKIVKLLVLFERTHTGVRGRLKKETGLNLISVIKAEDMGRQPNSWLKIKGIRQALSFKKT